MKLLLLSDTKVSALVIWAWPLFQISIFPNWTVYFSLTDPDVTIK